MERVLATWRRDLPSCSVQVSDLVQKSVYEARLCAQDKDARCGCGYGGVGVGRCGLYAMAGGLSASGGNRGCLRRDNFERIRFRRGCRAGCIYKITQKREF